MENSLYKLKSALSGRFLLTWLTALVFAASGLLVYSTASANTPVLSVSQSGNSITLNISGATPNSPVYLFQKQSGSNYTQSSGLGNTDQNGNFTSSPQTINFDGSSSPVNLYAMVNGVTFPSPSSPLSIPPGTCSSGCAAATLTLSQTSVSLNSPGNITVLATPSSGSVTVTNNTNSSVANAFASGDSVIITGQTTGSTTITVCSIVSTSQCGSILVSVNGGSATTLNFSTSNPVVVAGQSSTVTIYSPSNTNSSGFYISSNSNSNIVTNPSISGSTLYFSGGVPGNATLNICQKVTNQNVTSYCGTLAVAVGNNGQGGITISPNSLILTAGNTGTATINNTTGTLTISNNSNSSVVSASVSTYVTGQTTQTVTVYAIAAGSSTLSICPAGSTSGCVYLYVQVGSSSTNNSSGGVSFSVPNPVMTIGQSQSIAIYSTNGTTSYTISNNTSASIVSLSLSGSSLYLVGQNLGTSTVTLCQTASTICGTLYVTVNGSGGGLTFSPSNVNVALNQSQTVAITGGDGTYYISSNTNPSTAAVSLQSGSLYVTGLNTGTSSITVCQSSNTSVCGVMAVTVGGGSSGTGAISFSNSSPTLAINQSQSITISGGNGSYYISSISNPSSLTLNLSGSQLNLTGIAAGTSTVSLCQTGSSSCASLTITVNTTGSGTSSGTGSGSPATFITSSLPDGALGQNYSYQLQAQGGAGSYTYFLPSGSLPSGLTLSTNGLIQGTPSVSGYSSFTLEVSDSGGTHQNLNFSINVTSASTNSGSNTSTNTATTTDTGSGTYSNGQLINENGTISIVYKNTKTPFANAPAFLGLGFNFDNVLKVSNSGLALSGKIVVTQNGAHPRGSWLQSGSTVYFLTPEGLIPISNWATFLNNGGQASFIVKANSYDLALPKLSLMVSNDGRMK